MKSRGALIVFEGLDRSGKSTQAKLLYEAIKGDTLRMKAELWKYPNRTTTTGILINDYLTNQKEMNDHAIHLLFSANRWESVDEMKNKLNSGYNLIVDRYAYSGTAYSAAKKGMDFDWCKQCDNGLPKPDVVFYLDTLSDVTRTRSDFGAERYENSEFQNLVYKNFRKFFDFDKKSNFFIVNASDTIENLHKIIVEETLRVVDSSKYTDIGQLW
jgi:dTMP kinase